MTGYEQQQRNQRSHAMAYGLSRCMAVYACTSSRPAWRQASINDGKDADETTRACARPRLRQNCSSAPEGHKIARYGDGTRVDHQWIAGRVFEVHELGFVGKPWVEFFIGDNLYDRGRQAAIHQVLQAVECACGLEEIRDHNRESGPARGGTVVEERFVERRAAARGRGSQCVEYLEDLCATGGRTDVAAHGVVEGGDAGGVAARDGDVAAPPQALRN